MHILPESERFVTAAEEHFTENACPGLSSSCPANEELDDSHTASIHYTENEAYFETKSKLLASA